MPRYFYFAHYYSPHGQGNWEFVTDSQVTTSEQLMDAKEQLARAAGLPEVTIVTFYFLRTDEPLVTRVMEAEVPGARFVYFISYHHVDEDGRGVANIEYTCPNPITQMSTIRVLEAQLAIQSEFKGVSIISFKLLRLELAETGGEVTLQ